VPLCVNQAATVFSQTALRTKSLTVWWGTPVEMVAAFCRLHRDGKITQQEFQAAIRRLEELREGWAEVPPAERVRDLAQGLVESHPLRAADAMQLAAALVWSAASPRGRPFVSLDQRLAATAADEGFEVLTL
jgi:predicted nucleic acid-binding protein